MNSINHKWVWLILAGFMFSACASVDLNGLNPDNYQNQGDGPSSSGPNPFSLIDCEEVDSTYSTSVQPVFNTKCSGSGCHVNYSGVAASLTLDLDPNNKETASSMINKIKSKPVINNFNFFQSSIITAPLSESEDGTEHAGGVIFNSKKDPNFEKIYCWVEGGLKNNLDNDHNFGEELLVIFDTCDGCHNGSQEPDLRINNNSVQEIYDNIVDGGYAAANDTDSLILTKPTDTAMVPHGGNEVFSMGSTQANAIAAWISAGIPAD